MAPSEPSRSGGGDLRPQRLELLLGELLEPDGRSSLMPSRCAATST